jgi:hypothetical protein
MPAIAELIRRNPLRFGDRILGRRRWSRQQDMRLSVERNRTTVVYSANSVGKTYELGSIVVEWLVTHPNCRVICTGPTYEQVRSGLWQEVRKAYHGAKLRLSERAPGTDSWSIADGWDAAVVSVDNISALQGRRGRQVLIIVDEAQGVADYGYWDALYSLMTAVESRMVVSGNPLYTSGKLFDLSADPTAHVIQIDGFDHPNVVEGREVFPGAITREWIEERRLLWGENSPQWDARVRGRFPSTSDDQIVSLAELMSCSEAEIANDERPRAGLDVARYGGDKNVLTVFDARRSLVCVEQWTGADLMATAGRARDVARRYGALLRVDVCGMGAGVVDRLRELGEQVDAVDFGAGSVGDWSDLIAYETKFQNRRAELHWLFRHLVRTKQIGIPARYREVIADLVAPKYRHNSSGEIVVEDKESLRKRIGRSPDFGDSAIIAMSNAGARGPEEFFVRWR